MKGGTPDSLDELRAAYRPALDDRRDEKRSSCPDPDEILALVEGRGREETRLSNLDHVMQCVRCRRELDLLRALDEAGPRRPLSIRPWMAAAASVAILFGGGYGVWRTVGGGGGTVLRGPDVALELVAPPTGQVPHGPVTFLWRSDPEAFEYVFEVMDAEGETLFTGVTPDTSLVLDPSEDEALQEADTWWVRARLGTGGERRSEVRTLELPGR